MYFKIHLVLDKN